MLPSQDLSHLRALEVWNISGETSPALQETASPTGGVLFLPGSGNIQGAGIRMGCRVVCSAHVLAAIPKWSCLNSSHRFNDGHNLSPAHHSLHRAVLFGDAV